MRNFFARLFARPAGLMALGTIAFLVWMSFFDSNDFYGQYKLYREMQELKTQKEFYRENIKKLKKQAEAGGHTPETIEQIAREDFLMRKDGEDVFIVTKPTAKKDGEP